MNTSSLLYATIILSLLFACGSKQVEEQKEPVKPSRETFLLRKEKFFSSLTVPGELISFQQVDLYARETSFVKKIYVDVGSEVKEGQLLVSLEAPELTARVAGAESRWKSQEAVYTASKANYDRLLETSKTPGTISQNDLDQALSRMNSDLAQLESAKAIYREAGNTRSYLEIRAPFTGVISARNVNPGAYVGPSGKGSEFPLFTLQEQKHLRLVVSVPEAFTSYFEQGDTIDFKVKARSSEIFKATIKRHAGALDNRLRSERVEMDVANADKRLLPGMIAEVTIALNGADSTFVVPKTAVVNAAEGVFVIKVQRDTADWVYVTTGRSMGDKTEIFGNLRTGDKLITSSNEEIRKGSVVH
ncbi:MAG TPA: efflux RND transporter periplasmic adaptor subunit [Chryseolinea sp.]|nr:efflux RND transporter periplasmic adaptor subunit [Chryseolinea sp.]